MTGAEPFTAETWLRNTTELLADNDTSRLTRHDHLIESISYPTCQWFEFIVSGIIAFIICIIGYVGNTLTVLTMWSDRSSSAISLLLITLASADMLYLLSAGFMQYVSAFCELEGACPTLAPYLQLVGIYLWAVSSLATTLSTWTVVLISIQRWLAVCRPHSSAHSIGVVRRWTFAMVFLSVVYNIPRFLERKPLWNDEIGKFCVYRTQLADTASFYIIYKLASYYLFICAIPLCILTFTTTNLVRSLKKARMKRLQMFSNSVYRPREDVTLSLVIVIFLFVVCLLPNLLRRLMIETLHRSSFPRCGSFYSYLRPVSAACLTFNSAFNFVVYVLCSQRFRSKLLDKLGCTKTRHQNTDMEAYN